MAAPNRRGARRLLLILALALAACAPAAQPPPATPQPLFARTVDLSHVVRQDVPYLPGEPLTSLERDPRGRLERLSVGARTGTYLELAAAPDSPLTALDQLSPRELLLPAVVIDQRDQAQEQPAYALSPADLAAWEAAHGPIPPGALVLLVTGWDMRWGDPAAYLNLDPHGRPAVPGFSPAAAAILLDERGAAGLGVDAPAPAFVPARGHSLLLANLTGLEQLPPTGATVLIGALKLQAAQSSPARVLALVP